MEKRLGRLAVMLVITAIMGIVFPIGLTAATIPEYTPGTGE